MAQPPWREAFLAALAETSDVAAAAASAGTTDTEAYAARRKDRRFARRWRAALAEGYEHLELELLNRMRFGEAKSTEHKFDNGAALRLLTQYREAAEAKGVGGSGTGLLDYDVEAVRTAIVAKLIHMRDQARADECLPAPSHG